MISTALPLQVLYPDRPGRKIAVVGRSQNSLPLVPLAAGADIVLHNAIRLVRLLPSALLRLTRTSVLLGLFLLCMIVLSVKQVLLSEWYAKSIFAGPRQITRLA